MISLVLESDIPPMAREHLESALECTHFLLNIINTLLDFSKLETKHVELCPVPFLLRSSVGTILSIHNVLLLVLSISYFDSKLGLFEVQAREKKITLELDIHSTVPDSLYGDVDRLRQIVTHLGVFPYVYIELFPKLQLIHTPVDNSIKFSKPPGRISVHIELTSEQPPNAVLVSFITLL